MAEDRKLDYSYIKKMYGLDMEQIEKDIEERNIEVESLVEAEIVNLPPRKVKQPEPVPEEPEDDKKREEKLSLYDWVQCIIFAIVIGILIFVFVGRIIGVDGYSMYQTLCDRDKVIMSGLFYEPEYGDIVVLKTDTPEFGGHPLVKRVIATEGQTIDIDFSTGEVSIDGQVLDEPYINAPTLMQEDFSGPVTVPEGMVFCMGDNRNASTDSRSDKVGFVDERQILGKVYFVLIPGYDKEGNRDWSRIGSVYK